MAEREPDPNTPETPTNGAPERRRRSLAARILALFGMVIAGAVLLLVAFFLVLQTNWGAARVGDLMFGLFNPYDATETTYEYIGGTFLTSLELRDVAIIRQDSVQLAHIDTLRLRYNPLHLFRRTIKIYEFYLANPTLNAHQRANSSWDLLEPFLPDTTAIDTLEKKKLFRLETDKIRITGLNLFARFYNPDRDSILRVQNLNVDARDFVVADRNAILLDSLWGRFAPPISEDWVDVNLSAIMRPSGMTSVRGLRLHSSRTDLTARGSFALPGSEDSLSFTGVNFHLLASPLHFDDVRPFVPGLAIADSAYLDVKLLGRDQVLWVDADARVARHGTLRFEGAVTPGRGPLRYRGNANVRDLDLAVVTGGVSGESVLNADLRVNLRGLTQDSLDGTVHAEIFETSAAGFNIDRSVLDVAFNDGNARIDLRSGTRGAGITARGTARPFDEVPTYDLNGSLTNLDVGQLTDNPAQSSDIDATYSVEGRGIDPETASIEASIRILPSRINRTRIDNARLNVVVQDGELDGGVRVLFPEGQVFADARVAFGDTMSYSVRNGRFENVDLAAIVGADVSSSLNGSFRLNGEGTDFQTLSLRGSVDVHGSHYGEFVLSNVDVNARMNGGRVDASVVADLESAGSMDFAAVVYPFADVPSADVRRGEFRNIDVGRWTGGEGLDTDLNGTMVFSVRGFEPRSLRLRARLDLDPSRVNQQDFTSANLVGTLQRGTLNFSADALLTEGRFHAEGEARPFLSLPTYSVREGMFDGVNLGALMGNPSLRSDLNGTFAVNGRGLDPATMTLDGNLYISRSTLNEQVINTATVSGVMQRGQLDFRAAVTAPEGRTRLNGTADLAADVPTYRVTEGTFTGVDVGAITGNPNVDSRLTGSITFSGQGLDPETMRWDGTIRLRNSRFNEQQIDSAQVGLALAAGMARFDVRMAVPQGQTRLIGTARPFLDVPVYEVTQGSFSGLDVAAVAGAAGWRTRLNGSITLQGSGFDPSTMQLQANLALTQSTVNEAVIAGGTLTAGIQNGLTTLDTDLAFEQGRATVRAEGRFFEEIPVYSLSGSVTDLNLGDVSGRDSLVSKLTASFDFSGEGFDPETMILDGRISSGGSVVRDASISRIDAAFRLADGFLDVDTLALDANFADISGAGGIALFDSTRVSDFSFNADIRTAEPIRPLLPFRLFALENADFNGRVQGSADDLAFEIDGTIGTLVFNSVRVAGFDGHASGRLDDQQALSEADIDATADFISIPGLPPQTGRVDLTYTENHADFSIDLDISPSRYIHVRGSADLGTETRTLNLDSLTLQLDEDHWELLQAASITIGDFYRFNNVLLYSGDQQIAIDGIIDPNGQQNLVLTVENVESEPFADLLGFTGLAGTVNGALDLTGPAYAPMLTGTLTSDVVYEGKTVGDLTVDVDYEDRRLNLTGAATHTDGSALNFEGYLPMNLALAAGDSAGTLGEGVQVETRDVAGDGGINFTVVADSFSIDWIEPFFDRETIETIGGKLTGEVQITGTFGNPQLVGDARIHGGYLRIPVLEVTYTDITANATLESNIIRINSLHMVSRDGFADATGTVALQELTLGELDLNANLVRFWAVDTDQYRASVAGNIHLTGTTRQPVVRGNVQLVHTDIFLDQMAAGEIEPVELTEADIRMLQERFGLDITATDTSTFDFYESMDIQLGVSLERDLWLRQSGNPEMAIQFSGNLDLTKAPYGEEQIFGTIEVVPARSYIDQFGRRFDITEGTVTLNGDPLTANTDVTAEYRIRQRQGTETEATIILALEGRLDNLRTTLSSDPEMEQSDIISYIATGQPADPSMLLSGQVLLQQGTGLAINQISNLVEGAAREGLGLDVVQVQQNPYGDTELEAGKYVSSRVYVGVNQTLATANTQGVQTNRIENPTSVTVEYQFIDWLLLKLSARSQGMQANLLWEFAY